MKVLAVVFLLLVVTGCGAAEKAPDIEVDISPIEPSDKSTQGNDGLVIGSITMIDDGEWYGEVLSGVSAAAKDLGVTLVQECSDGDVEIERQYIEKFIEDKVDAIVICPITSDITGEQLLKAEASGIPVVTWNTVVDADITAKVCVDSDALGGDTGAYLTEYIRTYNLSGLKMGLITNESYTIGVARCDGFKESIKALERDGSITVVDEMLAETTEESVEAVDEMLAEHPDLDIIWCWNQTSLLACIDEVKKMDNKDLIITGTDMSMSLARDMGSDDVNLLAITTQLPYNMGYKAVVNAVLAAKGQQIDKTVVIPTYTYRKSDTENVEQYIESHAAFEQ